MDLIIERIIVISRHGHRAPVVDRTKGIYNIYILINIYIYRMEGESEGANPKGCRAHVGRGQQIWK